VCVHPEMSAEAMFEGLGDLDGDGPRVIDLPWEVVPGSTTRPSQAVRVRAFDPSTSSGTGR